MSLESEDKTNWLVTFIQRFVTQSNLRKLRNILLDNCQ